MTLDSLSPSKAPSNSCGISFYKQRSKKSRKTCGRLSVIEVRVVGIWITATMEIPIDRLVVIQEFRALSCAYCRWVLIWKALLYITKGWNEQIRLFISQRSRHSSDVGHQNKFTLKFSSYSLNGPYGSTLWDFDGRFIMPERKRKKHDLKESFTQNLKFCYHLLRFGLGRFRALFTNLKYEPL